MKVKQIELPEGLDTSKTYPGDYTMADFYRKITAMESSFQDVKDEYDKCRENYENYQAPSNVPNDKKYIVENLSTDLVRGLVGQLIGGKMQPSIIGVSEFEKPLIELHDDIVFRANKFKTRKLEPLGNHFYVEGKASILVDYNPYKKGPYGIGVPEISILKPHQGLWDNNVSSMHEDDVFRCVRAWKPAKDVETKYEREANSLTVSSETYEAVDTQDETVRYGNLYSLEYYVTEFKPIDPDDPNSPKQEERCFYMCKIWDRTIMLDPPKKTGFSDFTIIPVIHTQRMKTTTEPMGVLHLTNQQQDNINVVLSVMYEAVRQEIKNLLVISGASEQEERKIKREAKKIGGVVALRSEQARVFEIKGRGLASALIQWYERLRTSFDEIAGRYAPERGAVDGDLSGKAIIALQNRGTVPELVAKLHIEDPVNQMSMRILECISKKMTGQPFAIERKIDGSKRKIYYNTPSEDIPDQDLKMMRDKDPYSVFTHDDGNIEIVNDLRRVDFDSIDVEVEVVMNVLGWESAEANKALAAYGQGLMARLETTKKLYPREWKSIYDSKTNENQAMALVEEIKNIGEEYLPKIAQAVQSIKSTTEELDQLE